MPVLLDLAEQAVLVLLGAFLGFLALGGQVAGELVDVPRVVGLGDIVLPVLLHQILEVFAVGRSGVGYVVIGEPSLKLSLVPLVVCCAASPLIRIRPMCRKRRPASHSADARIGGTFHLTAIARRGRTHRHYRTSQHKQQSGSPRRQRPMRPARASYWRSLRIGGGSNSKYDFPKIVVMGKEVGIVGDCSR